MTDSDEPVTQVDGGSTMFRGAADLALSPEVVLALREQLPEVASLTVDAITVEVPPYAGALSGAMGENIRAAVRMALAGFLKLASGDEGSGSDPSTPLRPTLEGAYALGRGEARSGRTMDALLAAYRVGARVAWREMSGAAAGAGVPAVTMARFAELVFAYIDELSAGSAAGHADELSTSGRLRARYLDRLARMLLDGADGDALRAAAEQAAWAEPRSLTAVLLPAAQARGSRGLLSGEPLELADDLPGLPPADDDPVALQLVADADGRDRDRLLRVLVGRDAVVGPARPWTEVRGSYERALRAWRLLPRHPGSPLDTDRHLADLVLAADGAALEDLRRRVLAPLAQVRPSTAERLAETLRSWLLHQGRRDDVAADLHVHPQTVRYRMGQVRELFGETLEDPDVVLELVLALAPPPR